MVSQAADPSVESVRYEREVYFQSILAVVLFNKLKPGEMVTIEPEDFAACTNLMIAIKNKKDSMELSLVRVSESEYRAALREGRRFIYLRE